jgi:TusA-related sulfurtransferase
MARLSEYNFDLAKEICERVSSGERIKVILKSSDNYPSFPTWCKWKRENPELLNLYTCSIQDKAESIDDDIDEILADVKTGEIDPAQARVIIDTLKWKSSKYYPKMFGDSSKVDVTTNGKEINQPLSIEQAKKLADELDNNY